MFGVLVATSNPSPQGDTTTVNSQLSTVNCIDDELNISEGNKVAFFVDGRKVFLGYIFRRRLSADGRFWEVMACDQIR
ncbi:MAG: hypothetical protein FWH05_08980, partial [Oscillospiraceae bacterium]|nr:hypothetical protein [Oscillospiraceae bacterium]